MFREGGVHATLALVLALGACAGPRYRVTVTPTVSEVPAPPLAGPGSPTRDLERALVADLAQPGPRKIMVPTVLAMEGRVTALATAEPLVEPSPYYGVMTVTAFADGNSENGRTFEPARQELRMPAPLTPWLFGIDFVFELLLAPFEPDPAFALALELRERVPPEELSVRDLVALRARSRELVTAR